MGKARHPIAYQPTYPARPSVSAEPGPVYAAVPCPGAASRRWDLGAEKMVLSPRPATPAQTTPIMPAGKDCVSLQILRVKAASSKAEQYSCSSRSSRSCGHREREGWTVRGSLTTRAQENPAHLKDPLSFSLPSPHSPPCDRRPYPVPPNCLVFCSVCLMTSSRCWGSRIQGPAKAVALCEVCTQQPDSGFPDGPQLFRELPWQGPRTRSTTYPGLDQQLPSDREHSGETQWSTHCGDRRQSPARAFSLPPALPAPSFHPLPGVLWPRGLPHSLPGSGHSPRSSRTPRKEIQE